MIHQRSPNCISRLHGRTQIGNAEWHGHRRHESGNGPVRDGEARMDFVPLHDRAGDRTLVSRMITNREELPDARA